MSTSLLSSPLPCRLYCRRGFRQYAYTTAVLLRLVYLMELAMYPAWAIRIRTVEPGNGFFLRKIWKKKCPMVVLYEKNSLGNQPISDGKHKTTSRPKAVRSVTFTKKALLPQAAITLLLKKSQPTGVPLHIVRSVLLYSPRPRAQSNSVHMDARA